MLDCLNEIVGLSNTSCTCWDDSKPVDFNDLNVSTSGLYIAQSNTIPLRWTNSAADCENNGLWNILLEARRLAIRDVQKDFLAATQEVKSERFLPFTRIGDTYYSKGQIRQKEYAAAWIEPYCITGAILTITGVNLTFWSGILAPTNITIELYSSLDMTTVLATGAGSITANKVTATINFDTAFIKDLGDVRGDLNERFYIVYNIPANAYPVSNNIKIGCNCRDEDYTKNPFLQTMEVGGAQSDTIAGFTSNALGFATMQGMTINASIECDYYSWLCDLAQELRPDTPSTGQRARLGMALADTIQAKAVVNTIDTILRSSRINHYTMTLDSKVLYEIKGSFLKVYKLGIENLVYYMPSDVSDCLVCAEDKRINKSTILA